MPICSCPHCKTYLKVKESQLNVAQGFVKCADCQGLFKAKDFVARADVASIDWMPDGISDIELVRRLGTYVRGRNSFSKEQADYLIEHPGQGDALPPGLEDKGHYAARKVPLPQIPVQAQVAAPVKSRENNHWMVAALGMLTVLILQLFYIALNR